MGLVIWFFAWDIYYALQDNNSNINNVAHIAGTIFGYFWAKRYYSDDKVRLKAEIEEEYTRIRLNNVHNAGILESIRNRKM